MHILHTIASPTPTDQIRSRSPSPDPRSDPDPHPDQVQNPNQHPEPEADPTLAWLPRAYAAGAAAGAAASAGAGTRLQLNAPVGGQERHEASLQDPGGASFRPAPTPAPAALASVLMSVSVGARCSTKDESGVCAGSADDARMACTQCTGTLEAGGGTAAQSPRGRLRLACDGC